MGCCTLFNIYMCMLALFAMSAMYGDFYCARWSKKPRGGTRGEEIERVIVMFLRSSAHFKREQLRERESDLKNFYSTFNAIFAVRGMQMDMESYNFMTRPLGKKTECVSERARERERDFFNATLCDEGESERHKRDLNLLELIFMQSIPLMAEKTRQFSL